MKTDYGEHSGTEGSYVLSVEETKAFPEAPAFHNFVDLTYSPTVRSMREFTEQEVRIPFGDFVNRRFRCDRQPYTRLWFDAIDEASKPGSRINRFFATGPVQSGKTLACFIIPMLYHLFELRETVICAAPTLDMAREKWSKDVLPVINKMPKYGDCLPETGSGSRGGKNWDMIQFRHGPILKLMGGGGGDEQRSHFASRIVVITEVDKMDDVGEVSREADKISQLEARTESFKGRSRIYGECTASIEEGRIWQEWSKGTQSTIVVPCPRCKKWVSPEREHVFGWQDAKDKLEAQDKTHFICPGCGKPWTETQRITANQAAQLIHRGQKVGPRGRILGAAPPTDTLGFRWGAFNNLFTTAGLIGGKEWAAVRDVNPEIMDRKLLQFTYAKPAASDELEETPLDWRVLATRTASLPRNMVPEESKWLTVFVDTGLRVCYYVALAIWQDATSRVIDYGRFDLATDDIGTEKAAWAGLRDFRDRCLQGWPRSGTGEMVVPHQVWIDSGYSKHTNIVYQFCRESCALEHSRSRTFKPAKGYGQAQQFDRYYNRPTRRGRTVLKIGEEFHISSLMRPTGTVLLVHMNADYWKTWVHRRLAMPADAAGAMTLYDVTTPREHTSFCQQITAEREYLQTIPGQGDKVVWRKDRKSNHWLDCLYGAAVAGNYLGAQLEAPQISKPQKQLKDPEIAPVGRAYLVTER